ncbi:alpha/beta fold hydrolase [Streptomyces rubiginosohelvolus]|uniref:alpha/beta fold hydrolase n=1 Tax=Streptomyces rubiginosohelvolus TaxID=67362 RepID=UPI0037A5D898
MWEVRGWLRRARNRARRRRPAHSQGEAGRARTRDGRELYYQWLPGPTGPDPARPTVVFEGGLAAGRSYWAGAQAALADVAPTVVYDRSGLGRSPAAPAGASRRLHALAEDLGDLIDHLERVGPGPRAGDRLARVPGPPVTARPACGAAGGGPHGADHLGGGVGGGDPATGGVSGGGWGPLRPGHG